MGVAASLISASIQANLIQNGSFEQNDVSNNSWDWFQSSAVDGWRGSNIEIWDAHRGVNATDGQQFAELNAHGQGRGHTYSIWQYFNTASGQDYSLSFDYRARINNQEAFKVELYSGNNVLFSQVVDDHGVNGWSFFQTYFTAVNSSTKLRFTSLNSGTLGNFLDNIQVTDNPGQSVSDVPEPSVPLLMAMGLGLVAVKRRKLEE